MSAEAGCAVTVDLFIWGLDVGKSVLHRFASHLSEDELARANRFNFPRDRTRFVAARGMLREILGQRLSRSPSEIEFRYSDHGKPSLLEMQPPVNFNLSHSENLATLAVSQSFDLGVDIEFVAPLKEDVASHFFSKREIASLGALPPNDQLKGFYRCWTRKEAVVKAIGRGLLFRLDSFDVSVAANGPATIERFEDQSYPAHAWQLWHFEPAAQFIGAIACKTNGVPLCVARTILVPA